MDIKVNSRPISDGAHAVEVQGEIDVYTSPRVKETINELIDQGRYNLVINLEGVRYRDRDTANRIWLNQQLGEARASPVRQHGHDHRRPAVGEVPQDAPRRAVLVQDVRGEHPAHHRLDPMPHHDPQLR